MTASELSAAFAAQRAAYRPEHVPPFADLIVRRRRQQRRRHAVAGAALSVAAAGAVVVLPVLVDRPDNTRSRVGQPTQAAVPDEDRLREEFRAVTPPVVFGTVQVLAAGRAGLGDQPRQQAEGLTALTGDEQLSVSWAVLTPPLTDAEALAVAGTVEGGKGIERGTPVVTGAEQTGRVRSAAYRFDAGSFIRIWVWSTDGGLVTLTSGAGATTTDEQVADYELAARALLS